MRARSCQVGAAKQITPTYPPLTDTGGYCYASVRYGTRPGYGSDALHGLPDVFTSTVTAALEMGAMPYAPQPQPQPQPLHHTPHTLHTLP